MDLQTFKYPRADGSPNGPTFISANDTKQTCTGAIRQRHNSVIHESLRWAIARANSNNSSNLGSCLQKQCASLSKTPGRDPERPGRLFESIQKSVRVANSQGPISIHRSYLGASYMRQICEHVKQSSPVLQQPCVRSLHERCRCSSSTKLGPACELGKCPVLPAGQSSTDCCEPKSRRHCNSADVARSKLVPNAKETVHFSPIAPKKLPTAVSELGARNKSGAPKKSEMGDIRLEDLWRAKLEQLEFSERVSKQYSLAWAKSTLCSYNRCINEFKMFCVSRKCLFPPLKCSVIADFLCLCADGSDRPKSKLATIQAALSHLYECLNLPNVMGEKVLSNLISALVKSQTRKIMTRSLVMPVKPFTDMFQAWPENNHLSVQQLRLKCVVMLSLLFMCRPSDLAPKALSYDPVDQCVHKLIFSVDQVVLSEHNDSIVIKFLGIKNDYDRNGFEVSIDIDDSLKVDTKLNPVLALRAYIDRTDCFRCDSNRGLFLSLLPPYCAVSAATIARVLESAIVKCGLSGKGFSAKSFRPTGATHSVQFCDPDTAMKIGRWKTRSVFLENYIHSKPPSHYAASMLNPV